MSKIRRKAPVEDYLRLQTRYAHLFKTDDGAATIARLQRMADRNITRFGLLDPEPQGAGQAVSRTSGKERA